MEESREEILGANSTLRKEAYVQRGRFVWRLILRFTTWRASSLKWCSFLQLRISLARRIFCENLFEWIYSVENGSCDGSFYGFAV